MRSSLGTVKSHLRKPVAAMLQLLPSVLKNRSVRVIVVILTYKVVGQKLMYSYS